MVAQQVEIPELEDVDLMETGPLKTVIKDLIQRLRSQARSENADTENEKEDREGMQTFVSNFRDKDIGKLEPLGWRRRGRLQNLVGKAHGAHGRSS